MNGLALCAGFGGLERGIESLIPCSRTVCFVEGETYPASVLASKMEAGSLPKAPIWSNVRTFDGTPWRGKVSFISGGFPCQPYSSAGKQLAEKDPRDLWPEFARIIGEVRPNLIFLENVPGVVKWALPTILEDLSQMGYDAAWCVVAASDVGAPHRRKRWFLLAYSHNSSELVMRINESFKSSQEFEKIDASNPNRQRWSEVESNLWGRKSNFEGRSYVADSNSGTPSEPQRTGQELRQKGSRLEGWKDKGQTWHKSGRGSKEKTICDSNRHGLSRYANEESPEGVLERGKVEGDRAKDISAVDTKFNPRGVEDWWKVEPPVGRMVDGVADWVHRIRGCGNGVVPQQAAYAFQILAERLAWGMEANLEPNGCLAITS